MQHDVSQKTDMEEVDELGLGADFTAEDLDDLELAAEAAAAARKRFTLVFDATSSMFGVWNRAQTALKQAVDQINSRCSSPYQIKVVAYRDHEYDTKFIETCDWSRDAEYLKEFISSVRCQGGGDFPESIGHGLREVLQAGANQVILIGDAPGKRDSSGYEEAKIMGQQKCPIYALYTNEHEDTIEAFKKLAQLSGGRAMLLKPDGNMEDIFMVLLAKAGLQIAYQPTSIEGKRLAEGL